MQQPQFGFVPTPDIAGMVYGGDFTAFAVYGGDSGDQQGGYAYGGDYATDKVYGEDGRAG